MRRARTERPITILLNGNFELIPLFRQYAAPEETFRFICLNSTKSAAFLRPLLTAQDQVIVEPPRFSTDYAERILGLAVDLGVDFVLPMWRVDALADAAMQFQPHGVHILVPGTGPQLRRVEDKGQCFHDLADIPAVLPAHRVIASVEAFDAAVSELAPYHVVCFKPCHAVFGYGFYVLVDGAADQRPLGPRISIDGAQRLIARAGHRRHLVMQYLPGPEWSVDCLAHAGELLQTIIRRKRDDASQIIEAHAEVDRCVRDIWARLQLTGLFNIQLKGDPEGRPRLLEVNGRMAGGVTKSAASGLLLPLWAIRFALGTHNRGEMPIPQFGVVIPATPSVCSV